MTEIEEPKLTAEERPHAKRSSSQLGSLVLCHGFTPKETVDRKHWVTKQGERGHAALDEGDDGGLNSDFEAKMVADCETYAAKFTTPDSIVYKELRVETIEVRWGYFDRLVVNGKSAILLDWKFVRAHEVIDADINLQGKDYVVGIFEDPRFTAIEEITPHFVMPRFNSATYASKPFTRADIPQLKLEIYSILRQARKSDSNLFKGRTLTPHYDVCRFCGASGNCVALRNVYDGIVRQYDPDGYGRLPPLPQETHASQIKDPAVRGQVQMLASLAADWAKSVHHHNLTAALEDPRATPTGYALEYPKGRRSVTSAPALLMVAKEFGLSIEDLVEAANLSWGKVEELVRDKAPPRMKGKYVTQFNDRLRELDAVERGEETPKLVKQ